MGGMLHSSIMTHTKSIFSILGLGEYTPRAPHRLHLLCQLWAERANHLMYRGVHPFIGNQSTLRLLYILLDFWLPLSKTYRQGCTASMEVPEGWQTLR